jgi:hypothetical protein
MITKPGTYGAIHPHLQWIWYAFVMTAVFLAAHSIFDAIQRKTLKQKTFKDYLAGYFQALSVPDMEEILEDEENFRKHGGFQVFTDTNIRKIRRRLDEETERREEAKRFRENRRNAPNRGIK